ncbi:carbohydrate-binding protein [Zooshikella ganghwensis]|uniref:carbohydrate-binding protein n=1 Tax=Zooshikella ganghwensis TaxID=202772 RepID=UPI00048417E5|nr:carbohydrate-binding protein [Zooshikella ganghwensis]
MSHIKQLCISATIASALLSSASQALEISIRSGNVSFSSGYHHPPRVVEVHHRHYRQHRHHRRCGHWRPKHHRRHRHFRKHHYYDTGYYNEPRYSQHVNFNVNYPPPRPLRIEPQWHPHQSYRQGQSVYYRGVTYQAKWWTQGEEPGSDRWGPWRPIY